MTAPFPYLTIADLDLGAGTRVLVRSDLNVPLEDGQVEDDHRIRQSLPAIRQLRERGAVVVVCSHLGRPKGRDPALSLDPVARRLSELGGFEVQKLDTVVGEEARKAVGSADDGSVVLLENTRFEPGETKNHPDLAAELVDLADVFVLDAFGSAHRAHASTVGVAEQIRSAAGPLLDREIRALSRFLESPDSPYVVVLGGAKVSDKLGVMRALLPRVDSLLVGGGMCFTLLAAQELGVGRSMLEESRIPELRELLDSEYGDRIVLPSDVVVAPSIEEEEHREVVAAGQIADDVMGLDIGPETSDRFAAMVASAATVFWNGPMGVFERPAFREGTERLGQALAECDGFTAVGGGDTVSALGLLDLADQVDHVSTGGGAGLEFLEGKTLPGLEALARWAEES